MWCAHCQAEVAAEVASDNRRVRCANCGTQIPSSGSAAITDKTREARELLERWSSRRTFDRPADSSADEERRVAGKTAAAPLSIDSLPRSGASRARLRHDAPHAEVFGSRPAAEDRAGQWPDVPLPRRSTVAAAAPLPEPSHETHVPRPHFMRRSAGARQAAPRGNWTSIFGQALAYGGILGLTVGTTLVLWGYFGAAAFQTYIPTGWLIATLGQMLMFLGVMTIVSAGMEQTRADVSRSIESLGDQLLRIEQSSREHTLRGPSIPAERFDEPESENDSRRAASYVAMNAR